MINPNISKYVLCEVDESGEYATYQGHRLEVSSWRKDVKPGRRRLWLKYSILRDQYYLTNRA